MGPAPGAHSAGALLGQIWTGTELSLRDRALVTFAALKTRHEADILAAHGDLALEAGVTPAELSETITDLAFYIGWGNAIAATEALVPTYEARGFTAADLPPVSPDLLALDEQAEAAREIMVQGNFGTVSPGVVNAPPTSWSATSGCAPTLRRAIVRW